MKATSTLDDPKEVATRLVDEMTSTEYKNGVQEDRKRRLDFWLDRKLKVLAEHEMELISWGENVIEEMKKLEKTV